MATQAPNTTKLAFGYAADLLNPPTNEYAADPVGWVADKLAETFWSKQREIAESVATNRRTAVKSCHEAGKSYCASRLVSWWVDTHPPGSATVITTAPTFAQVRGILWKEIRRAHTKGNLGGHCNQTEWWIGQHEAAFGRKPSDTDENAFQGIHDEFVLVVLDEAGGIPEQLWVAANSLIADVNGRILAIGNPDSPSTHFYKVCQPGSGWNVIQIAAKDTPNFSGEKVPREVAKRLISQLYLDDMKSDVGLGSPLWISKVEGEFPSDKPDGVIRSSFLTKCRLAEQVHAPDTLLPVHLGVDVGGSEQGDKTVIRERRGCKAGRVWRCQSEDSAVVADTVLAAIVESEADAVKIDSVGIGWGVAGHLNRMKREGKHSATIIKVNVGAASSRPDRFPRLRDEIWWEIGHNLTEQGGWDLAEIDDKTAADLTEPKWKPDPRGRVQVEKKEETKKRLGRSPDDADALLLAFYAGGVGGTWLAALSQMADSGTGPGEAPISAPQPPPPSEPIPEPFGLGRLDQLQRRR